MEQQVQPGSVVTINNDVMAGGQVILQRGEQVVVEKVEPHPQMPEYKYVVMSSRLGQMFMIRDEDIYLAVEQGHGAPEPRYPGQPGNYEPAPEQQYFSPGDAFGGPASDAFGGEVPYQPVQRPAASAPMATSDGRTMALTLGTSACGLIVIACTFLQWVTLFGMRVGTGWQLMLHGSNSNGFSIFTSGNGVLLFSGFWSLLLGSVIIASGVMMFRGYPQWARGAQVAGVLGGLLALSSMITFLTHSLSVGIGLWLFIIFALASAVLAQFAFKSYR